MNVSTDSGQDTLAWRSLTNDIVEAVAAREGTTPAELRPRLYEVLDSDALEALFRHDGTDVTVEFTYRGYRVRASGDGHVTVSDGDD